MEPLEIGGRILAGILLIGLNAYFVALSTTDDVATNLERMAERSSSRTARSSGR